MGLGEIGRLIGRSALSVPELEIVAAVDKTPDLVGRPLGSVLGAAAPDVRVTNVLDEALSAAPDGVVLQATGSRLEKVVEDVERCLRAHLSVVSTCEELAFPWVRHEKLAERLDRLAQKRNVSVLGTGVNPGFVLDRLVATCAQVCGRIERVVGTRVVDASRRRQSLQRKIGAGLSRQDFEKAVEEGIIGHVGLMESAALAAMGVGLGCEEVDEDIEPVYAEVPQQAPWGAIRPGDVAGVRQVARAFVEHREVARLELTIALGAPDPRDEIAVEGSPPLRLLVPGGIPGDEATAWAVVHAAAMVGEHAEPGLMTVLDLPAGR